MRGLPFRECFQGFRTLRLHPLRSLLTILGIFIGVASVIWLMAFGEGISHAVQKQIEGLGADNIIVRSIKPRDDGSRSSNQFVAHYGLTRADLERLEDTISTIKLAMPVRELRREIRFSERRLDGRLVGCTPQYAEVTRLGVERGRFLSDADMLEKSNVCVLAAETARTLFPYQDPIGRSVGVDQMYYVVVGVAKERAPSAAIGGSLDSQDFSKDVYIPITTLWSRLGDLIVTFRQGAREAEYVELNQITLQVTDIAHVMSTADVVKTTLAPYHKNPDYGVTVPLELLEQAKTTRLMLLILMIVIAGISLTVGGIGIMNITLATVTERTREIGIRRALGAKRRDIARQFLIETTSMATTGGLTGIAGGLLCRPAVIGLRHLLEKIIPETVEKLPPIVREIEPQIVLWSIPLA
ncbi:MAG TPA: ABC transporter permease, partial [Caulifigura sp.]|nr:ABC transporter permease [Caulifigura sp.]